MYLETLKTLNTLQNNCISKLDINTQGQASSTVSLYWGEAKDNL